MARERMAKLLNYDHFEGHTSHISINFMIISKTHHQREAKDHRYLHVWPSYEDLELIVRSAMF